MTSFAIDPRVEWNREELSHGNFVLLGRGGAVVHVLAPPGARIQTDEQDRTRARWRHAVWDEDFELGPPALSIDEPTSVDELTAAEVVELLPVKDHDFVRVELARQLCRAETFGSPRYGGRLSDRQALLAGRTRSWATAELEAAFPGESWFEIDEPEIWIPATADELLARMPPSPESPRPRRRRRWLREARWSLYRIQGRVEYSAFVRLASAFRMLGRGGERSAELAVRCDRRAFDERRSQQGRQAQLTR